MCTRSSIRRVAASVVTIDSLSAVDNDVMPAIEAGMRAVWIRRGPWGLIQQLAPGTLPALVVDSLDELVKRIDEAWG